MKKNKRDILERRRNVPERIFFLMVFLFLFIWSAIMVYMLVWAAMSSLKTNLEYVNNPLSLPTALHFENYKIAIGKLYHNGVGFWGMLYNSLWQTVGPAVISITTTMLTGYIFAQYNFKGKEFLFALVVFTMTIPIYGNFAANYKLNYDLGLNDSYKFLIRAFSGFNGSMLLTYGYFKGIPKELRESVYMDGGSDFTACFKIYMPLARNIFVALFLLSFIAGWNDYQTSLLYFDKMPTLALGLFDFQQEIMYVANNPAYFAGCIIVAIPVLIIFIFGSDKIMGQLYSGGLKG